nr:MAG TPA: zinc-ribbon domain protein [Caudoviricetes sp.]
MKIACKYCGRYLMDTKGTTVIEGLICTNSKCKAKLNIKVVTPNSSQKEIRHKFTAPEVPPKTATRK